MAGIKHIIIVGAGPSGLLLALLLTRHRSASPPIRITLLDAADGVDPRPRAAYYGPAAVRELARAGVLADIRARGFDPRWMTWRKLWDEDRGAEVLGRIDLDCGEERTACLPLDALGRLFVEHVEREGVAKGRVELVWAARVVGVGEASDDGEEASGQGRAWVDVERAREGNGSTERQRERLHADYVVGCDGASSAVRRQLFGDKSFPGRTWDEQVVAANVYYDFTAFGYEDVNFFIHPEHWHMTARLSSPEPYWRVSYGETGGLTHEELLARLPAKFEAMLPGKPKPADYKLVGFSPYRVHQRLAPSLRKGRFLLAADAGHLCNPFGGLGLTGGIVDVGGLYDCLAGIHDGRADDSILDVYSDVRRRKWTDIIDPVSSENIRRLFGQDPDEAPRKDEFLKQVRRAETDPQMEREMREAMYAIQYDFTQHYRDA